MDEWENVRQKIKELQTTFLSHNTPDVHTTVDTVSVADYWKRRYEEDKGVWEQKLAAKEREQSKMQEKFLHDEEGIRELNFKLKELEERLVAEKSSGKKG